MNHCLNCGKECKNKFCSRECYRYYLDYNEEYREAFISKIKKGISLEKNKKYKNKGN